MILKKIKINIIYLLNKLDRIMKNLGIQWEYIVMLLIPLTVAIFLIIIALLVPSSKLGLVGIVLALTGIIISFLTYRQQKKLKEIDKGRKILEIRQKGYEIIPKSTKIGVLIFVCGVVISGILIGLINLNTFWTLYPLPITLYLIFFTERKYEIYEKGIVFGMQFIKWDEIKKVKWENGILEIKAKKVIGSIMIRDEDKRIKKIIEKYVKNR